MAVVETRNGRRWGGGRWADRVQATERPLLGQYRTRLMTHPIAIWGATKKPTILPFFGLRPAGSSSPCADTGPVHLRRKFFWMVCIDQDGKKRQVCAEGRMNRNTNDRNPLTKFPEVWAAQESMLHSPFQFNDSNESHNRRR